MKETATYTPHNIYTRRTSMPSPGFEPAFRAIKLLQIYDLERTVTRICKHYISLYVYKTEIIIGENSFISICLCCFFLSGNLSNRTIMEYFSETGDSLGFLYASSSSSSSASASAAAAAFSCLCSRFETRLCTALIYDNYTL